MLPELRYAIQVMQQSLIKAGVTQTGYGSPVAQVFPSPLPAQVDPVLSTSSQKTEHNQEYSIYLNIKNALKICCLQASLRGEAGRTRFARGGQK